MKFYYFYTLKTLWDGQGKIKVYYGMSRVKKVAFGKKIYSHSLLCIMELHVCIRSIFSC